jgi:hypothetical protein
MQMKVTHILHTDQGLCINFSCFKSVILFLFYPICQRRILFQASVIIIPLSLVEQCMFAHTTSVCLSYITIIVLLLCSLQWLHIQHWKRKEKVRLFPSELDVWTYVVLSICLFFFYFVSPNRQSEIHTRRREWTTVDVYLWERKKGHYRISNIVSERNNNSNNDKPTM